MKARITGSTKQDGSYLSKFLVVKSYELHGLVRRASTFDTERIDHPCLHPYEDPRLHLHYGDLTGGHGQGLQRTIAWRREQHP